MLSMRGEAGGEGVGGAEWGAEGRTEGGGN